jgi:hypothetical protein
VGDLASQLTAYGPLAAVVVYLLQANYRQGRQAGRVQGELQKWLDEARQRQREADREHEAELDAERARRRAAEDHIDRLMRQIRREGGDPVE